MQDSAVHLHFSPFQKKFAGLSRRIRLCAFLQRFIGLLILAAAIASPAAILAAPACGGPTVSRSAFTIVIIRTIANWDDHENNAWGIYLTNNHRKPHDFSKSSKREQSNYWNWRHFASGLVIKPNSTKAVAALRSVTTAATAAIASRPANGKMGPFFGQ